jgi:flagella basal body P-ring formation protein FlgA
MAVVVILTLSPETAPAAAQAAAQAAASPVGDPPLTLRPAVTVDDNLVRLGDLFDGAGDKAEVGVGYAPAPGRRVVFNARLLYRIAQAHGLDWRPLSNHDHAVVERESIVIEGEEIKRRILAALVDKGVDPDRVAIQLGTPGPRLHLPAAADPTIAVDVVAYDPRSGRFTVVVTAPSDDPAAPSLRLSGRLREVTEVPVLTDRVMRGEVIGADDVRWLRLRTDRLPRNTVLDADDLIGLTPKRTLRPGEPVRGSEVRRPIMVPKGGLVTLVLTTSGMKMTVRGRALGNGGEGDTIRVANARSHTIVEGIVTGAGRVTIPLSGPLSGLRSGAVAAN